MKIRAEINNPLLRLPAAQKIKDLPPSATVALQSLLKELSVDARNKAEHSWNKGKHRLSAYWKAVSVYANHIVRICR